MQSQDYMLYIPFGPKLLTIEGMSGAKAIGNTCYCLVLWKVLLGQVAINIEVASSC